MKRLILLCMFLLALSLTTLKAQQKEWGVGVRVGEPLGVNIKKYLNGGDNALEFTIGSYGYLYYNHAYGQNKKYYKGYYRRGGVAITANYLWQRDFADVEGLQWYAGVGAMIRTGRYYDDVDKVEKGTIGVGPNGLVGLEWFLPTPEIPMSLFTDVGLYMELAPEPFAWFNIGLGVRFNF